MSLGEPSEDVQFDILRHQFESLSSFPLVTLQLNTTCCVIPANLLALTVQNTRDTLQQILADNICLAGTWQDLCASLENHPSLVRVSLCGLRVVQNRREDVSVLHFLQALATCHNLQSLKLTTLFKNTNSNSTQLAHSLQKLTAQPNLRTLSLAFPAQSAVWVGLCQALHQNPNIHNLGLPAILDTPQERIIFQAVATLLTVNTALQTLSLSYGDPDTLLPVAKALQNTNRSLQHLQLYDHARNYYYKEATRGTLVPAIVQALQHNYVLQTIDLCNCKDKSWNKLVHFHLKMNQWYREHLALLEPPKQRHILIGWILTHRDSPSVVFYVLSQHPNLLQSNY
jgi:hypothetical protein